jgi:hypothetical protein
MSDTKREMNDATKVVRAGLLHAENGQPFHAGPVFAARFTWQVPRPIHRTRTVVSTIRHGRTTKPHLVNSRAERQ